MKQKFVWAIGVVVAISGRSYSASALSEYDAEVVLTHSGAETVLTVRSVRAIPRVLIRLAEEYGWMATFEEVTVAYPGDMIDMTSPTYHPTGPDDRALDPRTAPLSIRFRTPQQGNSMQDDEVAALNVLLKAHLAANLPGQYRVLPSRDGIPQVVPSAARNSAGSLMPVVPLMDEHVTLPNDPNRTVLKTVQAILEQVGTKAKVKIGLTGLTDNRLNALFPNQMDDRPAREILDLIISTLHMKCWTVLYNPSSKTHLLVFPLTNLHSLALASPR